MAAIELLAEVCNQQPESLQYMLLLFRELLDRGLFQSFFFLQALCYVVTILGRPVNGWRIFCEMHCVYLLVEYKNLSLDKISKVDCGL
jgi:hypothetical protein